MLTGVILLHHVDFEPSYSDFEVTDDFVFVVLINLVEVKNFKGEKARYLWSFYDVYSYVLIMLQIGVVQVGIFIHVTASMQGVSIEERDILYANYVPFQQVYLV